jgi:hypothetical protein
MNTFDKAIGVSLDEGKKPDLAFRIFKYSLYVLLGLNVVLFLEEDLAAAAITFGEDIGWGNIVKAYSQTFDTAAWVILLLLFELETAVIPDRYLRGGLKWVFMAVRMACYFFIVYALMGYIGKYQLISVTMPFSIDDVCSLIDTNFTYLAGLDDYRPIDWVSCGAMKGQPLLQIAGTHIISTDAALADATRLAMTDIVNACTWVVIVVLLEIEVLLQVNQTLTDRGIRRVSWVKGVFYFILLLCAMYWALRGEWLDFWDALLWLIAFVFIELNVFRWHAEEECSSGSGFYPLARA